MKAQWENQTPTNNWLGLNPIRFTNRASCALDSNLPTQSTFLILDNLDLGKALYRLSKNVGKNNTYVVTGIERFRYTVFSLSKLIANELLKGKLPLITYRPTEKFQSLQKECFSVGGHCKNLDDYISDIWENRNDLNELIKIDDFTNEHFTNQKNAQLSCLYLKKFSPLEAHLYGRKPDQTVLKDMAQAVHESDKLVSSCDDLKSQTDLKSAVYQLEIMRSNKEGWNQIGFNFWSSFKIYLSWAYRFSKEMQSMAYPYGNFLKNLDLEENIILFSNGCKSLEKPECSRDKLSLNHMRFLAQSSNLQELSNLNLFNYVPSDIIDGVKEEDTPVNKDILEFANSNSSEEWANKLRENLIKARGFIKLKISKALTQVNIIHNFVEVQSLMDDMIKLSSKVKSNQGSSEEINLIKQELYAVCAEYLTAQDEKFSFLKKDLELVKSDKSVNKLTTDLTNKNIDVFFSYLEKINVLLLPFCKELESQKIWAEPFIVNQELLAPWYLEYVKDKKNVKPSNLMVGLETKRAPLLALKSFSSTNSANDIICVDGAHCARKYLSSIIDLYAGLQYITGLINLNNQIQSPDMLNPYSEKNSCGVYDPWFKTKKTTTELLADIAGVFTWGMIPTPIYIDLSKEKRKVVSFNQLIKDGKVYYDPKFDQKKIQATLIADFGPLMGAPCMISVAKAPQTKHPSYYYLNGITFQGCKEKEQNNLTVYGPSELNQATKNASGCLSCTISLTEAIDVASFNILWLRPVFFLTRGIVRLVNNLKDPNDIPKSWEVDLNKVYRSYRKYGFIRKDCVNNFLDGEDCLSNSCEDNIADSFENLYQRYVSRVDIFGNYAHVYVNGCNEPILLQKNRFSCAQQIIKKESFSIPPSCDFIYGENK